jgi:hypothetical protein
MTQLLLKNSSLSQKDQFVTRKAQKSKWGTNYIPQGYKIFWGTKWRNGVLYPKMGYGW